MPYITKEQREAVLNESPARNAGELNYLLTLVIQGYLGRNPNYQKYNDALGALEGCKLELYRRRIVPYENGKLAENGDVYV